MSQTIASALFRNNNAIKHLEKHSVIRGELQKSIKDDLAERKKLRNGIQEKSSKVSDKIWSVAA